MSRDSYPCIVMVYVISTTMSWLFPIDKDTENPNLVMTSLLNNLDAAENTTNMTVPPNVVEEDKDRSGNLVDILIRKEGK